MTDMVDDFDELTTSEESAETNQETPPATRLVNNNVTMQRDTLTNRDVSAEVDFGILLGPGQTLEDIGNTLSGLPDFNPEKPKNALERNVSEKLTQTIPITERSYFGRSFQRDSAWVQTVEGNNGPLPAARERRHTKNMTATERIMSRLPVGSGVKLSFPCWGSGFWMTISTPSEIELLDLEREISVDKVNLGRESNGQIFSNIEVYATQRIVNFIIKHVTDCSIDSWTPDIIKSLLVVTDIPPCIAWMLANIYPNGYPFSQPCLATLSCNYVSSKTINLPRIVWTDSSLLSREQLAVMNDRTVKRTIAEIQDYQDRFRFVVEPTVQIEDGLYIRLAVPTVEKMERVGTRWINKVSENVRRSFEDKLSPDEQSQHKYEQTLLTNLMQYAHWFKSIRDSDSGDTIVAEITDLDMDSVIESLCSNVSVVGKIYRKIEEFIDNSVVSICAIPKESCPSCGSLPDNTANKHPELIPIDMVAVFFILRYQRLHGLKELGKAFMVGR